MKNRLRTLLTASRPACGAFVTLRDPAVLEIVALAGFDFAMIDLEHTSISLESLEDLLRAAQAHDLGVLVRVPDVDPKFILRVLDIGTEGILIPHVRGVETVQTAVSAVRYPPIGHRGFYGAARAADYSAHGLGTNRELAQELNKSVVLGILLEDQEAIAEADTIVATPGIDFVIVGPADLSASLGLLDTKKHPSIGAAIERVRDAARRSGVALCLPVEHATYPLTAAEATKMGAQLMLAGLDRGLLLGGFRSVRERLRTEEGALPKQ